jgi:4a-hydroxytetrahydrobiopterin dehydratase
MADLMSDEEVEKTLRGLDGWNHDDVYKNVHKQFDFNSFQSAITFVQHVGSIAGEMGHYPDIFITSDGRVKITCATKDEGGITENDIALIESLEILVNA